MNIILIICDELRFDAIGHNGNTFINTPNIDRLAEKSVSFQNCYCQAPVCVPSRFSLGTGQYPSRHGVINNQCMPKPDVSTLAQILNSKGYKSFKIGDSWCDRMEDNGFITDHSSTKLSESNLGEDKFKRLCWENETITRRSTAGPSTRTREEYEGYLAAEKAVRLIREASLKNEEFFVWANIHEPHPPYYPPKEIYEKIDQAILPLPDEVPDNAPPPHKSILNWKEQWNHLTNVEKRQMKAGYYGLVELADYYVGMVLKTIDEFNLWDDSMIIFTSDHGEQLGDHGLYNKLVLRDQSVHVPFFIYHPEIKPCTRMQFVEHVDLLPTICDYTGSILPEMVQGRSLKQLIENECTSEVWRQAVYSQINNDIMIRTAEWKLNLYECQPGELYYLKDDPNEQYNLIERPEYSGIIQKLLTDIQKKLY